MWVEYKSERPALKYDEFVRCIEWMKTESQNKCMKEEWVNWEEEKTESWDWMKVIRTSEKSVKYKKWWNSECIAMTECYGGRVNGICII